MMRALVLVLLLLAPLLSGCAVPLAGREAGLAPARACEDLEPIPEAPRAAPPAAAPALPLPGVPVVPPAIERDEWGVPVIRAETTPQIWYQLGFAMAQDRLWQLEHKRLAQQGRLSEVYGAERLAADVATRERRLPAEVVHGVLAALEPDTRESLRAYVAGINVRIDEVLRDPRERPAELVAYAWMPAPWTEADVVDVMLQDAPLGIESQALAVAYALLDTLPEEAALAAFNDIVPVGVSPDLPVSIPPAHLRYAPRELPSAWAGAQLAALQKARPMFEPGGTAARLVAHEVGAPLGGSNAIVVAPALSATGGALLLGGPQVGYETPAVYWEARVESKGTVWDVFIKPGEGLPRGHIGAAAFVLTTGYGDQHDLVLLPLDPTDPEAYVYGGEKKRFDAREETFIVAKRGLAPQPPAIERRTMRTSHLGPVLAHDPAAGFALVEQRFAPEGQAAYLDVFMDDALPARASDPAAMRAMLAGVAERVGESTNVIAAYADGTIEIRHTGRHVVRPGGQDWRLPRLGEPASEPTHRWAASCIPILVDPPEGYIVNWNNVPAVGWPDIAPRPWMWGASHRVEVLDEIVRGALKRGAVDLDDINLAMERAGARDAYAWKVLPDLLAYVDETHASSIRSWLDAGTPMGDVDGDGRVDHEGLAAFEAWRVALQKEVFGDELGEANKIPSWGKTLQGTNYDDHGISFWTEGVLRAILTGEAGHDWWDDVRTGAREGPADIVARTSDAIVPERRSVALVAYRTTGLGPELTMPQVNRGSINYVVDFGSGRVGTVVTPGQSGHVGAIGNVASLHMSDQLDLFIAFGYKDR